MNNTNVSNSRGDRNSTEARSPPVATKKILISLLEQRTPISVVDAAVGCIFAYLSGSILVGFSFAAISSVVDTTSVAVAGLERMPDF